MIKRVVCLLAALSCSVPVWAADPFAGTWKLDVAKSTFAKGGELKAETMVVVEQGENAMVTQNLTAVDGTPAAAKWTVPLKGGPAAFLEGGPPAGSIYAGERVNGTTMRFTMTVNGTVTYRQLVTLSADGKTLTIAAKGADPSGPVEETAIFHRQ
jgi:hypothetical protein